jgi:hypothetical protein
MVMRGFYLHLVAFTGHGKSKGGGAPLKNYFPLPLIREGIQVRVTLKSKDY